MAFVSISTNAAAKKDGLEMSAILVRLNIGVYITCKTCQCCVFQIIVWTNAKMVYAPVLTLALVKKVGRAMFAAKVSKKPTTISNYRYSSQPALQDVQLFLLLTETVRRTAF